MSNMKHTDPNTQAKLPTESLARLHASIHMRDVEVTIIESRGDYYVETDAVGGMLRSWERQVYRGLGNRALSTLTLEPRPGRRQR